MGSHKCYLTQVNTSRLNPCSQTPVYMYSILVYLPTWYGWKAELTYIGDHLLTEMVYPPTDGHPSKY